MREKVFDKMQTVIDINFSPFLKSYNFDNNNNNSIFISPIYTFLWRETQLFTRQIKVQLGKSTLIILSRKGKPPTPVRNKDSSVQFFLHGPRLFHLSTEKVPVQSVRNGHQSSYSRTNTIINNRNKRSKKFSIEKNYGNASKKL